MNTGAILMGLKERLALGVIAALASKVLAVLDSSGRIAVTLSGTNTLTNVTAVGAVTTLTNITNWGSVPAQAYSQLTGNQAYQQSFRDRLS